MDQDLGAVPRNQFLHRSRVVPSEAIAAGSGGGGDGAPKRPHHCVDRAMASALGAIDRADDPLSRSSVVEAYFDGTERDSVLGTYSITEEGETTLDAPLAAYRVEDGEVLPAR